MTQISTQLEDLATTLSSHREFEFPETQSTVNSEQSAAPSGAAKVQEEVDEIDGQWSEGEPNEELLAPDGEPKDDGGDDYLEIDSGIGFQEIWSACT